MDVDQRDWPGSNGAERSLEGGAHRAGEGKAPGVVIVNIITLLWSLGGQKIRYRLSR